MSSVPSFAGSNYPKWGVKALILLGAIMLGLLIGADAQMATLSGVPPKDTVSLPVIKMDSATEAMWMDDATCLVAHITKDGVFTCDYRDHYFPCQIYDSTVKKWFVRVEKNGDSLFYYRHPDRETIFIWNKKGDYDYADSTGFVWLSIGSPYTGSDTLRIKEQVWKSNKPKN